MPTPAELLRANLHEVFGNRNAEARRAVADRIYTADVEFIEVEGTSTGRDAIHRRAGELLAEAPPDFAFVEDGPVYLGGDTAALGWALGPAGAPPVVRGIDIITVTDGLISSMRTLLVG